MLNQVMMILRSLLLLSLSGLSVLRAGEFTPEQLHAFETTVRPLLAEHCFACHGPEKQNNGLRLDSRAAVLRGSDYGPVAIAGQPEASKLIKAIRHVEGVEPMPKKAAKLTDEAIATLTEWVRQGLPWPEEAAPAAAMENWRQHWAFQPVALPPAPPVQAAARIRQPLDAHVLARLEKEGLTFSPVASRAVLIRRAYLDLTGLPPTFDQVQAFAADPAPDAFARLVDQLLADPAFGERWARHWMDIARYADTKGYVFVEERRYAYAYTYRDWLVRSFNEDLSYQDFLIRQIAADKAVDRQKQPAELAAMGFLTLGRRFLNSEPDIIDDRLDVVFRGTQGLTVSCARCHDHKFDPIPTADYYSLYGVFASSTEPKDQPLLGQPDDSPEYQAYLAALQIKEKAVADFRRIHPPERKKPLPYLNLLNPYQEKPPFTRRHRNQLRELVREVDKFKAGNPAAPPRAMVLVDKPQPVEPVIFLRGNQGRPGPQVPRRFLKALSTGDAVRPAFTNGSGRLEMAQAIASPQNPLTARVWVNRVWTWLMGSPLVDTPSDFGVRTSRPEHLAVLDQLAAQFMAEGWSTKKLIRSILLSSTWQQSSLTNPAAATRDPENRLYWRQNRRRLDFEALRDSLLAVSGNLDKKSGGRGQEMVTAGGPSRRTLYGLIDRQNLPGLFRTFDFASPDTTAPKRFETTVPQQALYLMNSPFVFAQAAQLTNSPAPADPAECIRLLYRAILSRDPEPDEIQLGLACLRDLNHPARQTGSSWQNGWGGFDPATRLTSFTPFPYYRENGWSPSAALPDPQLAYVHLTAQGGHPGSDAAHTAIRRWVAPDDATVSLSGTASLAQKVSTGIIASIVHSRLGLLGTFPVPPEGSVETLVTSVEIKAGDTLDFILDCQGSDNSDSFAWSPAIRDTGSGYLLADAARDFGGPGATPLAAYAQILFCSNEFLFLD
jgi:cytochrome c553